MTTRVRVRADGEVVHALASVDGDEAVVTLCEGVEVRSNSPREMRRLARVLDRSAECLNRRLMGGAA